MTMADSEVTKATTSQEKNRRSGEETVGRRKDKKNGVTIDTPQQAESKQTPKAPNKDSRVADKNKKKGRRRRNWIPDDRCYGRFRCKICNRHWDSAFVFTIGGTKIVKYRQRCKVCTGDDAWVFPFRTEILRCSQCNMTPCECLCEDCEKLKHKRYMEDVRKVRDDDGTEIEEFENIVDPNFEYCDCDGQRKAKKIGEDIDDKKPHLAALCGKCLRGRPCTRGKENDNEP